MKVSVCEDIEGFYLYNRNEIKISGKAKNALIEFGEKCLGHIYKNFAFAPYGEVDFDIEIGKKEFNIKGVKVTRDCVIINECKDLENYVLEEIYEDIDDSLKEYIILDI